VRRSDNYKLIFLHSRGDLHDQLGPSLEKVGWGLLEFRGIEMDDGREGC
jgi:hypothetical protein